MRLIDRYLPEYDVSEHHSISIHAPAERVWEVLETLDFGEIAAAKLLLGLRALPKLLFDAEARRLAAPARRFTLADLEEAGFGRLAENPGSELLLGVSGRFWAPVRNVDPFVPDEFDRPVRSGRARAVWDFVTTAGDDGATELSTETRVACGDAASRRKFRAYWLLVRPFSGLIRILLLRAVRRRCESATRARARPPSA